MIARRRLGVALVVVSVCFATAAFGLAGCQKSTAERLVGTWETGQGSASGEVRFSADGFMKKGVSAPVRFTVAGDQLRSEASGETNPVGKIAWTSDDSFTYTVLGKTCAPVTMTYVRKR
jgi:hypothetical protein